MDDGMQIIEKSPFVKSHPTLFWLPLVKSEGNRSCSRAIAEWLNVRESTMRNSSVRRNMYIGVS